MTPFPSGKLLYLPIMKHLLLILSVSFLLGCGSLTKTEIEQDLKIVLTKKMGIEPVSVRLVKESAYTYNGLVTFDNGEEMGVEVTVDGYDYMWETDNSYWRIMHLYGKE